MSTYCVLCILYILRVVCIWLGEEGRVLVIKLYSEFVNQSVSYFVTSSYRPAGGSLVARWWLAGDWQEYNRQQGR